MCAPTLLSADDNVAQSLKVIKSVEGFGEGHEKAVAAIKQLEQAPPTALTDILAAMDNAKPLQVNWLRGAFESIAGRALEAGNLNGRDLETFLNETSHWPRARRLAYEWLIKVDPTAEQRIIPTMLDDPSPEMRRDAVAQIITQAKSLDEQGNQDDAKTAWSKALTGVVDSDQFDLISAALKKLGDPVDRVHHFGLITNWHIIGPFDNREMKGFDVAYPPEKTVDLKATYEGMNGEVTWQHLFSDDQKGMFDIAKLTAPHKGAIDYVYTEFETGDAQPVEFRLATSNAWKLWVNGELVFAREEYHRGMRFDQYIVPGKLKSGKNRILMKVCQNEQTQDWAQDWSFQFRICDLTGKAVHPRNRQSAQR